MESRIAIVGTGIAGLGAAWALHPHHDVTLFEARSRVGGHSHTVDVETAAEPIAVDTGFIVYNELTYPHLTRLFRSLSVPTQPSDMSFSLSVDGGLEYGSHLRGLVAQPSRLLRHRYRSMLMDIARFRRIGGDLLDTAGDATLGDLLEQHRFSDGFIDDYLLPMTGAIWSASKRDIRRFPAVSMLRFLANHGLIRITDRPQWRTVTGGSREYVHRLTAGFADRIRLDTPVLAVTRHPDRVEVTSASGVDVFDQVVIAAHSDQALGLLGAAATPEERSVLGAIRYQQNQVVLHSDPALMPRRTAAWSSWNSAVGPESEGRPAAVTYWMNRLQDLDPAMPLFVSLNPLRQPDPRMVHRTFTYAHPQFDAEALAAQRTLANLQGRNRTWFAGAYHGYGFHEDGLQSGLQVAAALGSPPPWMDDVSPMSSAPSPRLAIPS